MMNVKETINFKTLREKGPSAIEVKGDEVVQVVTKGSDIKVIISQEYFLTIHPIRSPLCKSRHTIWLFRIITKLNNFIIFTFNRVNNISFGLWFYGNFRS